MFDKALRKQLPPKEDFAYYWKLNYLKSLSPRATELLMELNQFRNFAVHTLEDVTEKEFDDAIPKLDELLRFLKRNT